MDAWLYCYDSNNTHRYNNILIASIYSCQHDHYPKKQKKKKSVNQIFALDQLVHNASWMTPLLYISIIKIVGLHYYCRKHQNFDYYNIVTGFCDVSSINLEDVS